MPRPVRVHVEGALDYVTSRASEDTVLFRDARDYEAYRKLLLSYQERYGFKLFAYVLLPDQLHLALELTNSATISAIMHAINSRYTKHMATRYGHTGHLFQERFHLTLIEKAPSLLRLTGFLHQLPQRKGVAGDLREYPWSSYLSYLAAGESSIGPTPGGEVQEVLDLLAREHPGMAYDAYVTSMPTHLLDQLEAQCEERVVGSAAFKALVESREQAMLRHDATGSGPQPQPSGPRRTTSWVLTASCAVVFLSLSTALLNGKVVTSLRQALRAQAQAIASLTNPQPRSEAALPSEPHTAQLATFTPAATLAGTMWALQVKPMYTVADSPPQTDVLTFEGTTVKSSTLSASGFQPSNYTLTTRADRGILWETMQTGPSGEVVCWRGEWDGKRMHGVLTRQMPGRPAMNFGFVGSATPQGPGQPTSEI